MIVKGEYFLLIMLTGNLVGLNGVFNIEGTFISNSPFSFVLLGIFKTFKTVTPFIGVRV